MCKFYIVTRTHTHTRTHACFTCLFDSRFDYKLREALKDFMHSRVTYEELHGPITRCTAASLEIDSAWETSVNEEVRKFEDTLSANIKQLFAESPPSALVKIPEKVYPKDKALEDMFLEGFPSYFGRYTREITYRVFWELIFRFLKSEREVKSTEETAKLLGPVNQWIGQRGSNDFMEFIKGSLVPKGYTSRFKIDESTDNETFFGRLLFTVRELAMRYDEFAQLDKSPTPLYSLIMFELGITTITFLIHLP